MTAYKLFRQLKSRPGEIFPLFIGKDQPVPLGKWLPAQAIPTKGFALRPGWHAGRVPRAPWLSEKGRVWAEVEVPEAGTYVFKRPGNQGGEWLIAPQLRVKRLLTSEDVRRINNRLTQASGIGQATRKA